MNALVSRVRRNRPRVSRGGFTLVEVLAATLLLAIVLPAVMQGISLATNVASASRHRTEATGLAQAKLAELVATNTLLDGNQSGDFAPDWPEYKWESIVSQWDGDTSVTLDQIEVRVTWNSRGRTESLSVSTLVRSSL